MGRRLLDDNNEWRWTVLTLGASLRRATTDQTLILASIGAAIFLVLSPIGNTAVLGFALRDIAGVLVVASWVSAVVSAVWSNSAANGLEKMSLSDND